VQPGTRTHGGVSVGLQGCDVSACPRSRALILGEWRIKFNDFNALNFLDPI